MVIRKNVKNLSSSEKKELVDAILKLKSSGRYNLYVLRHAQAPMANIHRCPAFLPWHRSFLLDFEKELQQVSGNSNLAIPYWNWAEDAARADPKKAPVWANDLMGGDGDPADSNAVKTGPFRRGKWTIIDGAGNPAGPLRRSFGTNAPTLATQASVDVALSTTPYDRSPWNLSSNPSFRNLLEGWYGQPGGGPGLHNRGHVWVGGSMLPMTSPNDPVFFLHHCFVDLVWAWWQYRNPNQNYRPTNGGRAGQNYNDLMERTVSGTVTPKQMWNHKDLGYDYDLLTFGDGNFDAAGTLPNKLIYVSKGDLYVRYSNAANTSFDKGYPLKLDGLWGRLPEKFKSGFDSIATLPNGKIYVTKGKDYIRYSDKNGSKIDSGYPKPIKGHWGKLPASFENGFDAMATLPNGCTYVTKGGQYVRYSDSNATKVDSGYPKPIKGLWGKIPKAFEAGFDSVTVMPNGKTYVTKGDQYVRYSDKNASKVDAGYPKSIRQGWARNP